MSDETKADLKGGALDFLRRISARWFAALVAGAGAILYLVYLGKIDPTVGTICATVIFLGVAHFDTQQKRLGVKQENGNAENKPVA